MILAMRTPLPPVLASSQDPFVPGPAMLGFLVLLGFVAVATVVALVASRRLLRRRAAGGGARLLATLLILAAAFALLVAFTDQQNNLFYRRMYQTTDYPAEPPSPRYTGGTEPGATLHLYEETSASSIYGYWQDGGLTARLTVYARPGEPAGTFRTYDRLPLTTEGTYPWDSTIRVPKDGESSRYVTVHWQGTVTLPGDAELMGRVAQLSVTGNIRYPRADRGNTFVDTTLPVQHVETVDFIDEATRASWRAMEAKYKSDKEANERDYGVAATAFARRVSRVRAIVWGIALALVACAAAVVMRSGRGGAMKGATTPGG